VDRRRVVEEKPAREAGARERGDVIRRDREPGGVAREDGVFGVRMRRQYQRGHAGVVADRVRVSSEEELGLNAATVALDAGRLGLDDARELADRVIVTTLVDVELSLLRRALLRFTDAWFCFNSFRGANSGASKRKHQG
jgi:hypothetical protein